MKSSIYAIVAVSVLAVPGISFAQTDSAITRTQVRGELKQLEQAGYIPASGDEPNYPTNIQAAEARVAAQNETTSGYGGSISGSSASAGPAGVRPAADREIKSLYFGQ